MSNYETTQTGTLRLLETGELIPEREFRQREAAEACYRTQLICAVQELQNELLGITHSVPTAIGRRK